MTSQEILNEGQRKAVEFDRKHLLVLAGAGTGKPRPLLRGLPILSNRVLTHQKFKS